MGDWLLKLNWFSYYKRDLRSNTTCSAGRSQAVTLRWKLTVILLVECTIHCSWLEAAGSGHLTWEAEIQ